MNDKTHSSYLLLPRILWFGMSASYPLLLLLTVALPPVVPGAARPEGLDQLHIFLPLVFAAAVLLAWMLRMALRVKRGTAVTSAEAFSVEELEAGVRLMMVPLLVTLALHGVGVIAGFVLAMLERDWKMMIPYFVVGIGLNLLVFPTVGWLLNAAKSNRKRKQRVSA